MSLIGNITRSYAHLSRILLLHFYMRTQILAELYILRILVGSLILFS